MYKGKRYEVGATADDGTTLTSTVRKVTNFIPLALNGTTYLPLVWGAGGANYTEICLYAGVNGHEPANDAQAVLDTKKSGRHEQATSGIVGPLTLVADPNQATYYFDTTNQIIKFNPEWVQYIRTYVTDDSTIARAEYTEVNVGEFIDVTDAAIKVGTSQKTPTHEIGGFIGCSYYYNGSSASDGYSLWKIASDTSSYDCSSAASIAQVRWDGTGSGTKPARFCTRPVELKYDGLTFDAELLDTNGAGYGVLAFLDENFDVIENIEGIAGSGALTVLTNKIIRSADVTQAVVVESTPSGQGGTVENITVTVPTSYKYVVAILKSTFVGTNLQAGNILTSYSYIGEPAHGEQVYHEAPTFLGQQLSDRISHATITATNHVVVPNAGITVVADGSAYYTCHAIDDDSISATSNIRVHTGPIELPENYEGLVIDSNLLDTVGIGFGVVTFLNEDLEEVALLDGYGTGSGTSVSVLANEFIKDSTISSPVVDSWPDPAGGSISKIRVRYPDTPEYKYIVACLTSNYTGTPEAYAAENITCKYHYIGEYAPVEDVYTKLTTYIDSKEPTTLNDKYTWSRMYGANVCLFGGSFATSTYGQKAHEYWKEKLNINLTNYAVGGAGTIQNVGTTPMQTQVTQMINAGKKYDLYILWCSTNDQRKVGQKWVEGSSQTIESNTYAGQDFDAEVIGAITDTARTSQSGGMNWIFNQIYTFDPKAKIIVFNSMRHFSTKLYSGTYAKDDDGYNDLDDTAKSSVKYFSDKQNEVCRHWGIPYLDQYNIWGVNSLNKSIFVRSDNLHPTDDGYIRLAALQVELIANL